MESIIPVRFIYPENKPRAKVYLHESGLEARFSSVIHRKPFEDPLEISRKQFESVRYNMQKDLNRFDLFLAFLWGDSEQRSRMHIYGYRNLEDWPNPEQLSRVSLEEGLYRSGLDVHPDSLIIFGREEELRRNSPNLEAYMNLNPALGDLEPKITEFYDSSGNKINQLQES